MKYKLALILVLLLVLLSACSNRRRDRHEYDPNDPEIYVEMPKPAPEPEPEPPRLVYIALGDSVSEGFGIWTMADRHTSIFFESLYAQGFANEYVNLAVSGYTTTNQLALLHGLEPNMLEAMQYASVITLNIGGNNILEPFFDHLPSADEVQRIADETMAVVTAALELAQEIIEFAGEASEVIEEVLDFADEVIDFAENFRVLDVFRINDMVAAAGPVLDNAAGAFAEVNVLEAAITDMFVQMQDLEIVELFALFTGSFPAALEAEFQESIRRFEREFVEIIEWLTDNAPDATIIVNTVYNPLPTHFFGLHIGVADESARLINAINRIIYEESRIRGYIVSDIYTGLSQRLDMMNLNFDLIHPNAAGHQVIAELNLEDFLAIVVQ